MTLDKAKRIGYNEGKIRDRSANEMAYRAFQNFSGQYEIEECESGMMTFDTIEQAQGNIDRMIARDVKQTPASDYDNALRGIPSVKSLKTLPAKLAQMKRDAEIENGSERM